MEHEEPSNSKLYPEPSGIKSWAEEDRPREKLLLKGKQSLSESELIAILVRTGTREKTAVDVAKELMKKANNDLNALSKFSVKDILDLGLPGMGETKAITIVAALELGRRRQSSEVKDREKSLQVVMHSKYFNPSSLINLMKNSGSCCSIVETKCLKPFQ